MPLKQSAAGGKLYGAKNVKSQKTFGTKTVMSTKTAGNAGGVMKTSDQRFKKTKVK